MTAPLKPDTESVNAELWLRAWLLPIVTTSPAAKGVGSHLWVPGLPKPYRAVKRISGPQTEYTDEPLMWVHTFGEGGVEGYPAAAAAAAATDDRVRVLVGYPGWGATLPDGRTVHCDWAEIVSAAHEEFYSAEPVVTRFVSEYRFGLSFVPAS